MGGGTLPGSPSRWGLGCGVALLEAAPSPRSAVIAAQLIAPSSVYQEIPRTGSISRSNPFVPGALTQAGPGATWLPRLGRESLWRSQAGVASHPGCFLPLGASCFLPNIPQAADPPPLLQASPHLSLAAEGSSCDRCPQPRLALPLISHMNLGTSLGTEHRGEGKAIQFRGAVCFAPCKSGSGEHLKPLTELPRLDWKQARRPLSKPHKPGCCYAISSRGHGRAVWVCRAGPLQEQKCSGVGLGGMRQSGCLTSLVCAGSLGKPPARQKILCIPEELGRLKA